MKQINRLLEEYRKRKAKKKNANGDTSAASSQSLLGVKRKSEFAQQRCKILQGFLVLPLRLIGIKGIRRLSASPSHIIVPLAPDSTIEVRANLESFTREPTAKVSASDASLIPPHDSSAVSPIADPASDGDAEDEPLHFPITAPSEPPGPALSTSQRLWNAAYTDLEEDAFTAKLLKSYLAILTASLSSKKDLEEDELSSVLRDPSKREMYMKTLIKEGQMNIATTSNIMRRSGDLIAYIDGIKKLIDAAIGNTSQAALPWAGICIGLQILANPNKQMTANLTGIVHITSRMDWYCAISDHLPGHDKVKVGQKDFGLVLEKFEENLVGLYKALLLYQIKSICYYRSKSIAIMRGLANWDSWEADLQNVKDTEAVIEGMLGQLHREYESSSLLQLVTSGQKMEKLLGNFHQEVQNYIHQSKEKLKNDQNNTCMKGLFVMDPQIQMNVLASGRGDDTCIWLLQTEEFEAFTDWRNAESDTPSCRLLWINGNAATERTALMINIIRQFEKQLCLFAPKLTYFFFQDTDHDSRSNDATAALRSLIWFLILQQPHLIQHLQSKYENRGQPLFENSQAFDALSDVFKAMVKDVRLEPVYFIVDNLDACEERTESLVGLISKTIDLSNKVKWLVSSRPEVGIQVAHEIKTIPHVSMRRIELDSLRSRGPINTAAIDNESLVLSEERAHFIPKMDTIHFTAAQEHNKAQKALRSALDDMSGEPQQSFGWFMRLPEYQIWVGGGATVLSYIDPGGKEKASILPALLNQTGGSGPTFANTKYIDVMRFRLLRPSASLTRILQSLLYQSLHVHPEGVRELLAFFLETGRSPVKGLREIFGRDDFGVGYRYALDAIVSLAHFKSDRSHVVYTIIDGIEHLHSEVLDFLVSGFCKTFEGEVVDERIMFIGDEPNISKQGVMKGLPTISPEIESQHCCRSLYFKEMRARRNDISKPIEGTTDWIWKHPSFVRWKNSPEMLWINGKPGSGKSTIARMITDSIRGTATRATSLYDLAALGFEEKAIIADFFYSARMGEKATRHIYMLRSLLHQMLDQDKTLYPHFQATYRALLETRTHEEFWDMDSLKIVFEHVVRDDSSSRPQICCVLDGFDESEDTADSSDANLLFWLSSLATSRIPGSWLSLIVLSRHTFGIAKELDGFLSIRIEKCNETAIQKIVDDGLSSLRTAVIQHGGKPGKKVDKFIESQKRRLLDGADGQILWVKLVLQEWQTLLQDKGAFNLDELDAIFHFPNGLEKLYEELIKRLCDRSTGDREMTIARNMLIWACFPPQLMSLDQFRDAIAMRGWKPSNASITSLQDHLRKNRIYIFEDSNWLPVENDILRTCGCLLEVVKPTPLGTSQEPESRKRRVLPQFKVQVTHQTAKEFLTRANAESHLLRILPDQGGSLISDHLYYYLLASVPLAQGTPEPFNPSSRGHYAKLAKYLNDWPLLSYALEYFRRRQADDQLPVEVQQHIQGLREHPEGTGWWFVQPWTEPLQQQTPVDSNQVQLLLRAACQQGYLSVLRLLLPSLTQRDILLACIDSIRNELIIAARFLLNELHLSRETIIASEASRETSRRLRNEYDIENDVKEDEDGDQDSNYDLESTPPASPRYSIAGYEEFWDEEDGKPSTNHVPGFARVLRIMISRKYKGLKPYLARRLVRTIIIRRDHAIAERLSLTRTTPAMPNVSESSAKNRVQPAIVSSRYMAKSSERGSMRSTSSRASVRSLEGHIMHMAPPPRISERLNEFPCYHCGRMIDGDTALNPSKWWRHLKKGLNPYICIFEGCDTGNQMYSSRDEWREHVTNCHRTIWRCDNILHPVIDFNTENSFLEHQKRDHAGNFDDEQLPHLARNNSYTANPLSNPCPFCGETCDHLEDHIGRHFRYCAILSLWFLDHFMQEEYKTLDTGMGIESELSFEQFEEDTDELLPEPEFTDDCASVSAIGENDWEHIGQLFPPSDQSSDPILSQFSRYRDRNDAAQFGAALEPLETRER
ncbi:hypothetical protein V8C37DRAFT_285865 [Trichoderma ceciliae]